MKIIVKTFLLFLLCISGFAQVPNSKSLIVAEYLLDTSVSGHYTYLVSYNFQNGKYISKDTIFGAEMDLTNDSIPWFSFRFDMGKNFIYQNRYAVSGTGNVVDTKTKSLVMNASDDFIEAHGDSLLFHRNNIWGGTGFLYLDLQTRSYEFVKDTTFRAVKGLESPDHKHGIEISESTIRRKIILYNESNSKDTIVQDCGYGTSMSPHSSSHGKIPVLWIDNSNFIYAEYSLYAMFEYVNDKEVEPKLPSISIRKVNIETHVSEFIGKIDSVPQAIINSKFYFDEDSNLVFYCKKGFFKIESDYKSISHYIFKKKIENGFEVLSDKKTEIKYNDTLIGSFIAGSHVTTDGYIACEYGEQSSNMPYPVGIKVWSVSTKAWTTIKIPWVSALVGWIEN
jgi:hypothetical protein